LGFCWFERTRIRTVRRVKPCLLHPTSFFQTYAAQDFSSTHVFCFCASDEAALRQWVCRLRIAMLGRRLLSDYEEAVRRISSRTQANSQQASYKTLTRKSPIECRRASKHTVYSASPQRMPKRQVSTGSLNSSPVIKMPLSQQMPHSQQLSFTGNLSPPLPRAVGRPLKNGDAVDCYQYQNLR
uniref:PH domain-containing protein n=1 Tax=Schistocephalus solidus TaxID=70667 RepID=A0A183SBT5_SCHSO